MTNFSTIKAIQADMDKKIDAIKPISTMDDEFGYEGLRASCDVRPRRVSAELFELFEQLNSGNRKEVVARINNEIMKIAGKHE